MITESSLTEMRTRIEANKPFIYWGNLNMEERLAFLETTRRTLSRLSSGDTCDQTLDDVIKAQEHEVQRLKDMKAERDTVTSARFYPTEADPIPHPSIRDKYA
ncbi:hypothetical protein SODG_000167 [Sodalis praecaptivus]|nr:hypothetical protein NVIRENTERO_03663 [Sodalis praecaptivus]